MGFFNFMNDKKFIIAILIIVLLITVIIYLILEKNNVEIIIFQKPTELLKEPDELVENNTILVLKPGTLAKVLLTRYSKNYM